MLITQTTSASSPRLTVAVIGGGGIGSTFAYQLARASHDVTVVARPDSVRLGQLQRDQGVVRTTGDKAELRVADALDEQRAYDLVLVTTLDHQVDAVLPALKRSQVKAIHFMFNTFDPQRLQDAIGAERCSFGMPFVMGRIAADGRLDATISASRKTLHGDQRWVDLFNEAGVPSVLEPQMQLWLRCHVPMCIAMESVSVAGQRRGAGASWREARTVALGLKAGFRIIKGLGLPLHPPSKAMISASPAWVLTLLLWSVSRVASFRELLATGINECRALIDGLAAAASKADPALPEAATAVQAMKP